MVRTSVWPRRRTVDTDQYVLMVSRMVRAAGKRVAEADAEDLVGLIDLRDHLDAAIVAAVRGLRLSGSTWQEIGDATGTTRQAAIMKWARKL